MSLTALRILALVPARGGSKRLPGKNIRPLAGRPLIAWTITAARDSGVLAEVLVSTDDPGIADAARQAGGLVPWLRPAELSGDEAGSVDVALHALDWFEAERGAPDALMLLQPTSPFRSAASIRAAVELFATGAGRSVVSLSPARSHPAWCFRIDANGMTPCLGREELEKRSQDLCPAFELNGAIYLITPSTLRAGRSFTPADAIPLVMPDHAEALDIDTALDWHLAEALLRERGEALS